MATDQSMTEREMLEEEYEALHGALPESYYRRQAAIKCLCSEPLPGDRNGGGRTAANAVSFEKGEEELRREVLRNVHRLSQVPGRGPRAALCLSGGGIRSATFALGLIQGLARRGLLLQFDYLSTVSGGGYIGAWLSAWMHRDPDGSAGVNRKLGDARQSLGNASTAENQNASSDESYSPTNPEPLQIQHLRDHSNYLTPHMGLFRPDSWTLLATYVRNLFLNWLILLPLMAAILLLPRIYVLVALAWHDEPAQSAWYFAAVCGCIFFSLTGTVAIVVGLPSVSRPTPGKPQSGAPGSAVRQRERERLRRPGQAVVLVSIVSSFVLSSLLSSLVRAWFRAESSWRGMVAWCMGIYAIAAVLSCVITRLKRKPNPPIFLRLLFTLVIAGVVVGLTSMVTRMPNSWLASPLNGQVGNGELRPAVYATLLVPTFLMLYVLLITLYVGFTSEAPGGDDDREWLARIAGWLLLVAVGWAALCFVALFSPLFLKLGDTYAKAIPHVLTLFATALGLIGARSASSGARERRLPTTWKTAMAESVPGIAAQVAVAGIFVLIAMGLEVLVNRLEGKCAGATTMYVFGAMVTVTMLAGKLFNSNRLSLHAVYRDRLIRAFLGASNAQRLPDPFTGFDPDDNIPMHHLRRRLFFTEDELKGAVHGVDRVAGIARLLTNRTKPIYQYIWKAGERYLDPINTERLRADRCQCEMNGKNLLEPVKNILNCALRDPQLVWESRFREERERAAHPQIAQAFARLEYDGCPNLLNRLILEEECHIETAPVRAKAENSKAPGPTARGDVEPGDSEAGKRVYLLKAAPEQPNVPKPFHVVNLALNLIQGRKLAWQQRKASSFTVSPLHSGFSRGYRPSVEYGGAISLGTAVTISGAAASPNMGYHSSPAVTFLMTLFNVRLGWWLGNPAQIKHSFWRRALHSANLRLPERCTARRRVEVFERGGPEHSVVPLIDEALGRTNSENAYIYLSDGGHFDNLGVYEMIRRRCGIIVVSDASCDPKRDYEDLANVVRKVRIDMGIPITMRRPPRARDTDREISHNLDDCYCMVAEIDYAAVDGEGTPPGKIVYLKAAIHSDSPVDLYSHARMHESFPHEPTSNQWFTESQFESYRRLGLATIDWVFKEHVTTAGARRISLAEFIAAAEQAQKNGRGGNSDAVDGNLPSEMQQKRHATPAPGAPELAEKLIDQGHPAIRNIDTPVRKPAHMGTESQAPAAPRGRKIGRNTR